MREILIEKYERPTQFISISNSIRDRQVEVWCNSDGALHRFNNLPAKVIYSPTGFSSAGHEDFTLNFEYAKNGRTYKNTHSGKKKKFGKF